MIVPQGAQADVLPVAPSALAQAGLAEAQNAVDTVASAVSAAQPAIAVPTVTAAAPAAAPTASVRAVATPPAAAPQPAARPAAATAGAASRVPRPPAPPAHPARAADPPVPVAVSAARAGAYSRPPAMPAVTAPAVPVRMAPVTVVPMPSLPAGHGSGGLGAGGRRRPHGAAVGHLHPVARRVGVGVHACHRHAARDRVAGARAGAGRSALDGMAAEPAGDPGNRCHAATAGNPGRGRRDAARPCRSPASAASNFQCRTPPGAAHRVERPFDLAISGAPARLVAVVACSRRPAGAARPCAGAALAASGPAW